MQSRMGAQVTLALFIAIAGLLVAAFLAYHLALTACGLTSYETLKRQQARTAQLISRVWTASLDAMAAMRMCSERLIRHGPEEGLV